MDRNYTFTKRSFLSQGKYILYLLKKTKKLWCKSISTPIDSKINKCQGRLTFKGRKSILKVNRKIDLPYSNKTQYFFIN
jgi:hypothetical protein